jgi:hypothetical protein
MFITSLPFDYAQLAGPGDRVRTIRKRADGDRVRRVKPRGKA